MIKYACHTFIIKFFLILIGFLLFTEHGMAQFTITENFKGSSVGGDIILGGKGTGNENAYLTSGNNYNSGDPINQGWLRLTESAGNRAGYAYINKSFPSTLGVAIEFEYKAWRKSSDSYNGADGFSVFLFDATAPFSIGGYGGSLGYANYNDDNNGLAGAYLGIGIDEYGNFATNNDGRHGGVSSTVQPNSITLRGPASSGWKYLTSKQLQNSPITNGPTSMDYNTVTTSRPTDATFYRKVKILITPTGTAAFPRYQITVYWTTTLGGAYTQLLTYTTTDPIPNKLKLGFAASTGGGFNYHEIRNVLITTPGNVRVQKSVDQTSQTQGNDLTYTVNVTNDTGSDLNGILLNDTIKDGTGNILSPVNDFQIKSITFNNQGTINNTAEGFTSGIAVTSGFTNPFATTLNVAKNSTASFTIVGTIKNIPSGGVINNNVSIDPSPSGITDTDLSNNYSTVSTTVLNPKVDLKIEKGVDNHGMAKLGGNVFTIQVTNISSIDKPANTNAPVTVTDVIPAGLTVTDYNGKSGGSIAANGWTTSVSNNIYTFTRTDLLKSQFAYPAITINVIPDQTHNSWTNTAKLAYIPDTNSDNNSSSTILKWHNYWYGTNGTDWSIANNWTAGFVPGAGWDVEFATKDNNSGDDGNGKGAAINDLYLDSTDQGNGGRVIGNLINNSDMNLVVTMGNQLTINGTVQDDNADKGTIVVKADPYNSQANGTLLFADPTKNQNVEVIAEFYNQAHYCDECGLYKKQWQYFGIPVQSALFPADNVSGNETVNQWVEAYNGNKWQPAPYAPDTQLKAFKGYEMTNDAHDLPTGVYSFTGILNVGDVTVPLTKTDAVNYSGANLIGNSYTAAIPIASALTFDNQDQEKEVHLFNTGTRDQWRKLDGSSVNLSGVAGGQYLAVPFELAGQTPSGSTTTLPAMIPSTQTFMVLASKAGNLSIDYSQLVKNETITNASGDQIATRSATTATDNKVDAPATGNSLTVKQIPALVMDVIGDQSADRVWVFNKKETTYGFDNGWDGRKIADENSAQLYVAASDSSKLQVATVPSFNKTVLGFVPDKDGTYTLNFALSKDMASGPIYLKDLLTGKKLQIVNGQSYTFTATRGETVDRFVLSSTSSSSVFSSDESLITVSTSSNTLTVANGSARSCSVFISDEKGGIIRRSEVKAKGEYSVDGLAAGTYIVRLQNAIVDDTRKVTVQ